CWKGRAVDQGRQHHPLRPDRDRTVAMSPQRRENSFLAPLLDLAAAVDDEGHFLAVFHRLDGRTFGGGFDVSDLRITSGFKLGYKLLLGQGIGRREDANHQQTINDRLGDCSRRHDLCSWLVRNAETYSETSTPIRHGGSALEAGIASHLGRERNWSHDGRAPRTHPDPDRVLLWRRKVPNCSRQISRRKVPSPIRTNL